METKLYVGNLPFDTNEDELKTLFSEAGEVKNVTIIKDKYSGQSKGFGFIEMDTQESMQKAIQMFNEYNLRERPLKVNVARPKTDNRRPFNSRNRRGGGGGRGGRGGRSDYSNRY